MDRIVLAVFFAALAAPALCQIHLGPEGSLNPAPTCYECDGHGHHTFPECLNHQKVCHHDEVCSFTYGNGDPKIRCQRAEDCTRETSHPMRNCTGGGVEVHNNECKKCCHDTQCAADLSELLRLEFLQSPHMMCPGECSDSDIQTCIDKSLHCRRDQFCQVTKEHGMVKGECKDDHEWHHCEDEKRHHPCEHAVGHGPAHHHGKCYWDCCDTLDCLNGHFGSYADYWTAKPAATTPVATMMTTPMPTQDGASLWERLHGKCEDQLVGDGCATQAATNDICHDRLALSVCPKTCGLCDAINSTVCKDTVVNDGCKDLMINEDVCSSKMAVFLCPNTCNMCDELLNSVITSLVDGNSESTDVPPSLIPSANPPPTFNCNDLKQEPCSTLDALCGTSLVKVVCPDLCDACTKPIQPVTTDMVDDTPTTQATQPTPQTQPIQTVTTDNMVVDMSTTQTTTTIPAPQTQPIQTVTTDVVVDMSTTQATTIPAPQTQPTQTVTSDMVVDMSTTQTTIIPAPQTKPTATADMVINNMSTTDAPQPPTTTTTMAPVQSGNGTTVPACSDHLNGMNCADLKDVCQSIMALSVCPAYCGLC